MKKPRVAILISGRGSNMRALINAAKEPGYPAKIVGVLSNVAEAAGLDYARGEGVPTEVRSHKDLGREAFERSVEEVLHRWQVDLICLAGFMRILTPEFVGRWESRIINVHPSLLPEYRGLHTHERALADGAIWHGCTVHYVTAGLDEGKAIIQSRIAVLDTDTPESLAARVLVEEHRIYPEALAMVAKQLAR